LNITSSVLNRFWAKVLNRGKENSCWLWSGSLNTFGYGQLNAYSGTRVSAHRLSFLIHNGYLPQDKLVCHTCNNKACVNPSHLYLGNHQINGLDAVDDGLTPSGESHYAFISDEVFVARVKELKAQGLSQTNIAEIMECNQSHISRLLNNKNKSRSRKSCFVSSDLRQN